MTSRPISADMSLQSMSVWPASERRQTSSQTSHAVTILFIPCLVSKCLKTVRATFRSTSSEASQPAVKRGQTRLAIGPEKMTTRRHACSACLTCVWTLADGRGWVRMARYKYTNPACLWASALLRIDWRRESSAWFSIVTTEAGILGVHWRRASSMLDVFVSKSVRMLWTFS